MGGAGDGIRTRDVLLGRQENEAKGLTKSLTNAALPVSPLHAFMEYTKVKDVALIVLR